MLVWDLLTDAIGLPADQVAPLAALSQTSLGELSLARTVDDVRALIERSTPIHVLPVGTLSIYTLGVHLRPADRARGEVRLVRWHRPHQLLDAGTPRDVAFSALFDLEDEALQDDLPSADAAAYARANEVFGPDAFTPGQMRLNLLRDPGSPGPDQSMTGAMAAELDLELDQRQDKLALYDRARQALPDLMHLHAAAARSAMFLFDFERAATALDEALRCWHHTAWEPIGDVFDRARMVASQAPAAFDDHAREQIASFDDDEATAALAARLGASGDGEALIKLLNDRGHFHQDYRPALDNLAKLYRHLGWDWALELLKLRPS